jgi:hypothetical protein
MPATIKTVPPARIMNQELFTKPGLVTAIALVASAFAATSCAGPGPHHHGNRGAISPMSDTAPHHAAAARDGDLPAACAGCTTTPKKVYTDRGPAGKSVVVSSIAGTKHECTFCHAANAAAKSAGTARPPAHAPQCIEKQCCLVAAR